MLLIYMLLKAVADQLYAESANLMIVAVFAASFLDALLSLLLIVLFSADAANYNSILANMIPQAVSNSFTAFLLFTAIAAFRRRFSR